MGQAVTALVVGFVVGYLITGAGVAIATIGRPRRALDTRTSVALAVGRVALAVALVTAVIL